MGREKRGGRREDSRQGATASEPPGSLDLVIQEIIREIKDGN
jgi:hypothetical protein